MSERDEPKQEKMPVEDRRRILKLLGATVAAPVVTVLFHGPGDQWAASA